MEPLRVSRDGRTFVQDGRPFFFLGDTQWDLFHTLPLDEADAVLANREERGFSVVLVMFTGVGDGTRPGLDGRTAWIDGDPSRPDEAYFARADRVFELAAKRGLVLVAGVYHQVQRKRLTADNARAYAAWIARRYRDTPNLVWSMYPRAEADYVSVSKEVAHGLEEGDGGAHLITVHPDPSPTSSSFILDGPWLACHTIQTQRNHSERIVPMMAADYALKPPRPVVMAEGGYENPDGHARKTPLVMRKQAYWSHLSGGHHVYGHDMNYLSPATWRAWIDAPGAVQMGIYRRIVTGVPRWWTGVPDAELIADGKGSGMDLNLAARSPEGDWALVYVTAGATVTARMDRLMGPKAQAEWVDPRTGKVTALGEVSTSGTRGFTPPGGWEDAVLRLTAA